MSIGNSCIKKVLILAGLVICLFASAFFSALNVFANPGGSQDIKLSDVFFVYPKSLQQEEPNIRGLNAAAENAILTMESDGEIWSLIQAAMTDPDEATVNRLKDMILGTDTRGEDCALSATEDLLSQIGSSAEIYEFAQWCTGPYQEFYKLAKTTKDVNKVIVDGAEYFVNLRYERVAGVVNALLADDDGIVRDVILSASEEHRDEILDAIDKGSEGFSDAMELLKTANRFTELVDTIVLLECVEDDMIDYLYSVVTTEDLKHSIDAYRNYKNGNYTSYVLDKWVKADVLEEITENFEDIILEIGLGTSGPSAAVMVYKITKVVLKYSGKLIGYLSGYGDADDLITAYKSWNYVQDLERVLSEKRRNIIYEPCTVEAVCEYERAYDLYVCAVVAFAKNAKKANTHAGAVIDERLAVVEAMREGYSQNGMGPFRAYIQRCKDYLALEENRDACYRQVPDNEELNYTLRYFMSVAVRAPSDTLEENSIYAAADGNLFYDFIIDESQLEITCDAYTPGDVTFGTTQYGLKVAEGASFHIKGDFNTETSNSTYMYSEGRNVEVYGKLITDGNFYLSGNLTLSGDNAKLEVNGDASIYGQHDIQSGEMVFNGGVGTDINIGEATVYLNTPAGKEANLNSMSLSPVEITAGEGTNASASVVLWGTRSEDGNIKYEIGGNAPSHKLINYGYHTQKGKSFFRALYLKRGNLTIAGETTIGGNTDTWEYEYGLTVMDGGILYINGDFYTESGNSTYLYSPRYVEIYGELITDGNFYLIGDLTLSGDNAKLEVNGDANVGSNQNIQSGKMIFNGAVSVPSEIGEATVYLNTPADKGAYLYAINLSSVEMTEEEGTRTPASVVLRGIRSEDGNIIHEISGNAPSHKLTVYKDHIQKGKSLFRILKLNCHNSMISGEMETIEDFLCYEEGCEINVADGASLHIGRDLLTEYNTSYLSDKGHSLVLNGTIIVDGTLDLDGLTMTEETARLEAKGDAYLNGTNTIQSGVLFFNRRLNGSVYDIGSAEVIAAGQNDAEFYLTGITLERKGVSPNMRITKADDTVFIGPYEEDVPLSAAVLHLGNQNFELADGTYDIDTVKLSSGSLNLNHSLVFNGNLALIGGNAVQSAENSVVTVGGDFSNSLSEGIFSGGSLEVAGNFSTGNYNAYCETESHKTVLNGTGAQTIRTNYGSHLNVLELDNTSEEGVVFENDVYVDKLFDHQRNSFTLAVSEDNRFADYDNDGVKDHKDPYPKDPEKSYLDFTVLPIADQKYTGEELKPELVVTDEEGTQLDPEADYETVFTDNIRPGTATAVVTGKRFHTASKEVTFNIICDHVWGKWELVETPTAEQTGSRQRTCSLCGETETQDIPALEAVLNLPAGLTRIESEAFSGLASADAVRIPETVTEIAEDAFTDSDIVIIAPEGSYAVEWAENHNVIYIVE